MYNANCMLHNTNCKLHASQYKLQTVCFTTYNAHNVHGKLTASQCKPNVACFRIQTKQSMSFSLHTVRCILLTTHYTVPNFLLVTSPLDGVWQSAVSCSLLTELLRPASSETASPHGSWGQGWRTTQSTHCSSKVLLQPYSQVCHPLEMWASDLNYNILCC